MDFKIFQVKIVISQKQKLYNVLLYKLLFALRLNFALKIKIIVIKSGGKFYGGGVGGGGPCGYQAAVGAGVPYPHLPPGPLLYAAPVQQ